MTTFAVVRCGVCKQIPSNDACGCEGKTWTTRQAVPASGQNKAHLLSKGFIECRDIRGDIYYCGPGGRFVWMYPDDTWFTQGEDLNSTLTLEAYLKGIGE